MDNLLEKDLSATEFDDQAKTRALPARAQTVVVGAGVVELAGDRSNYRELVIIGIPQLMVALVLLLHVAHSIEPALSSSCAGGAHASRGVAVAGAKTKCRRRQGPTPSFFLIPADHSHFATSCVWAQCY